MKWISVEDELPAINGKKTFKEVLTWDGKQKQILHYRGMFTYKMKEGKKIYKQIEAFFYDYPDGKIYNVLHWMSLPEPPKE